MGNYVDEKNVHNRTPHPYRGRKEVQENFHPELETIEEWVVTNWCVGFMNHLTKET